MEKSKNIKLIIVCAIIFVAVMTGFAFEIKHSYASNTTDTNMLAKAKTAAKKDKYAHSYVIVTSISNHKTQVFSVNKKKKKVTLKVSSPSCTGAKTKKGTWRMTGYIKYRKYNKDYFEYYYRSYNNSLAIHSILYKNAPGLKQDVLYHNTRDRIQNSSKPYTNNWSSGCTRTNVSLARFVYRYCGKNTPYIIY